jgi:hypothetical protein
MLATLKANDVKLHRLCSGPGVHALIEALHADTFFTTFAATREEEALGIITGAWMGGMRGAVLMQTSGFGTIPNALASLVVPSPEFRAHLRVGARHARRVQSRPGAGLQDHAAGAQFARGRKHHITRQDELAFTIDRSIKQAVATQAPVTFILSPLLTGGKVFEGEGHDRKTATIGAHNAKVMNRFDLTKRLVRQLKREEAGIGGNRQCQFRSLGQRPASAELLYAR